MVNAKEIFGKRYLIFLLIFLGMLSAFGPFVTDMYLPVLPGMAEIFNCSASKAQLGLTMSLVGLAVGQLFFGPLSVTTSLIQFVICSFYDTFIIYEVATLLILTGVGYLFTASTTLAMSEGQAYIGSASAIFGALGFLFGGVISPIVGIGDILRSTMIAMLVCAFIIFILAVIVVRRK